MGKAKTLHKGKGHCTCYSAAYKSQARDQQALYNLLKWQLIATN